MVPWYVSQAQKVIIHGKEADKKVCGVDNFVLYAYKNDMNHIKKWKMIESVLEIQESHLSHVLEPICGKNNKQIKNVTYTKR